VIKNYQTNKEMTDSSSVLPPHLNPLNLLNIP